MNTRTGYAGIAEQSRPTTQCTLTTIVALEEGTCCDRATRRWIATFCAAEPTIHRAPTFRAGAAAVMRIPNSALLLPHVHELCRELTICEDWILLESFVLAVPNPPLFLACRPGARPYDDRPFRCACIGPLRELTHGIAGLGGVEFVDADTTQAAARRAASDEDCEYRVTNEHGLVAYGLEPVHALKKMTIWWMPFHYSGRD